MGTLIGTLLLLTGIFALAKGELKLSGSKISRGTPARLAGVLMILAFPIAIGVSIAVPVMMALFRKPLNLDDPPFWRRFLPLVVMIVVAVLALVVAFRGTNTPPKS